MRFIQNLFGTKPRSDLPFQVGDKVSDLWGQILVITEIKPEAQGGLGLVRTRNAAGVENTVALMTHNLTLVDKKTPLASDFSTKRVRPDELMAGAYLRPKMVVLHGVCQTNCGGFNCEPYQSCETTVSDLRLGTELLRVLKEASTVPIPENLKIEQKKIFDVCKVRSWTQLCENTIYCSVTQTPDQIAFLPTANEGRGFNHLPEPTIRIAAASAPDEVGRNLRGCFQICR